MTAQATPQDYFVPVRELDIRSLPLCPEDAFVLSRVDGKSDSRDIAHATSLPEAQVALILQRLAEFGAVRKNADARCPDSSVQAPAPVSARSPSPEQVAQILTLHARLAGGDHYVLLGVEPSDTNARIKQAYHEHVVALHPDRFFGAELGNLRPLLLEVFQRLTEAHKVLTRAASRARYDASRGHLARER